MVNRSSDYGHGRADSTDRQSQKTNTMTLSGIVSPDIQIQSVDHPDLPSSTLGFEPQRMLAASCHSGNGGKNAGSMHLHQGQLPYGNPGLDVQIQAQNMTRSNQSSVQAMRNTTLGQSTRLSPMSKKRNIRQTSSTMNKSTSLNEVKKVMQKATPNAN